MAIFLMIHTKAEAWYIAKQDDGNVQKFTDYLNDNSFTTEGDFWVAPTNAALNDAVTHSKNIGGSSFWLEQK